MIFTVGYDSNTAILNTSNWTDPGMIGHTTPDLHASGAGRGNGTLTPAIMPYTVFPADSNWTP